MSHSFFIKAIKMLPLFIFSRPAEYENYLDLLWMAPLDFILDKNILDYTYVHLVQILRIKSKKKNCLDSSQTLL